MASSSLPAELQPLLLPLREAVPWALLQLPCPPGEKELLSSHPWDEGCRSHLSLPGIRTNLCLSDLEEQEGRAELSILLPSRLSHGRSCTTPFSHDKTSTLCEDAPLSLHINSKAFWAALGFAASPHFSHPQCHLESQAMRSDNENRTTTKQSQKNNLK